jgi:sterol desaturase/sphingolipid hydroxylase (fatty acid hydroxylase superfamily)
MSEFLIHHETAVRLGVCVALLALVAAAEVIWPRRRQLLGRAARWPSNLGIVVVDALALRLFLPVAAVGAALWAESAGVGLLNWLGAPWWIAFPVAILALDLSVWAQHVATHRIPVLWRLHRVHHADLDFDVTTALRFHPIEIVLSMVWKIMVVVALGAPAAAVVLFEVLLNAGALFSHGNLKLPAWLDRSLRVVLVTPDMHRVHHSVVPAETHSNFGFCFAWWDRLFGTYRPEPAAGQEAMTIGLPVFRDPGESRLDRLVTQPFREPRQK